MRTIQYGDVHMRAIHHGDQIEADSVKPDATCEHGEKPHNPLYKKCEKPNLPNISSFCLPDCSVSGTENIQAMTRCSICMRWCHNICIGEDSDYIGVWTCPECRVLPSMVLALRAQLDDVISLFQNLNCQTQSLKEEKSTLVSENNRLSQKVFSLESKNAELVKLIRTLSDEPAQGPVFQPQAERHVPAKVKHISTDSALHENYNEVIPNIPTYNRFSILNETHCMSNFSGDSGDFGDSGVSGDVGDSGASGDSEGSGDSGDSGDSGVSEESGDSGDSKVEVTLIGDSMVRGVATLVNGDEFDAMGFVYPGGSAKYIGSRLKNISLSQVTVISAGTNDISTDSLDECKSSIRELVNTANHCPDRKSIIMCSIPHRYDDPELNYKIDQVNQYLEELVSNKPDFHLLCHDTDPFDYKKDGLHFDMSGLAKFSLEVRHLIRNFPSE